MSFSINGIMTKICLDIVMNLIFLLYCNAMHFGTKKYSWKPLHIRGLISFVVGGVVEWSTYFLRGYEVPWGCKIVIIFISWGNSFIFFCLFFLCISRVLTWCILRWKVDVYLSDIGVYHPCFFSHMLITNVNSSFAESMVWAGMNSQELAIDLFCSLLCLYFICT